MYLRSVFVFFFVLTTGIVQIVTAETILRETFNDGSAFDGTPARWVFVPGASGTMNATSGDLVLTPSDSTVAVTVPTFDIADVSIRAQVRIGEGSLPSPPGNDFFSGRSSVELIARGSRTTFDAYLAGMFDDGVVYINRVLGPRHALAMATTDLRPLDEDVVLQFDVFGTSLSMWAWRPGEPIPSQPLLAVTDIDLPRGEFGVNYSSVALDPMPGHATYRSVHVANTHIPEPSTVTLTAVAFVGALIWRRQQGGSRCE